MVSVTRSIMIFRRKNLSVIYSGNPLSPFAGWSLRDTVTMSETRAMTPTRTGHRLTQDPRLDREFFPLPPHQQSLLLIAFHAHVPRRSDTPQG